jgi:UDP-glucose 4-epimerase
MIARAPLVDDARNEVINVGADQPYTILELANAVARAFGVEREVLHLPARHEVVHAYCAHEKARRIFGTSPTIDLEEGIGRMARWVKAVGVRPPTPFPGEIEVPIGMPPSWAEMTTAT